jgi:glycosyltransferase involved in cell wall biosynthesis
MNSDVVLLLGRKDEPTDAVEEYCQYLCGALARRSVKGEVVRVPWKKRFWADAVDELRRSAVNWRGRWIFVQYTALAWSERGFPRRVVRIMRVLRKAGARVGVVFHDVEPFTGNRVVDVLRRQVQLRVMRQMLRSANLAIFTVPLNVVSWLGSADNATFIPVGANLPQSQDGGEFGGDTQPFREDSTNSVKIGVYGITGGSAGEEECTEIARAVRFAVAQGAKMDMHVFGRGAAERETELRDKLRDVQIALRFDGLMPANSIGDAIRASDTTLFVRGAISTRRGSAIAGIACGKPVIAYKGPDTAPPITEAGVVLVDRSNSADLGEAILRVATDRGLREALSKRSIKAQEMFFSWDAIGGRYVEAMNSKA